MNYRVTVLFVFAALVSFVATTNAAPASDLIQIAGSQPLPPSTYTPPTFTLGTPINQIHSFDVDEYGRIYIVDSGKRTVFVFNSDGSVASVWRKNNFGGAGHAVFGRIDVVNSELLFFSGGWDLETHKYNVIRISPYEPDGISEMNDDVYPIHVLGLPDRSYVVDYKQQKIGYMDSDGNNYSTVRQEEPYDTYLTMVGVDRESNAYVYKSDTGVMSVWNRGGLVRQFQLQKEDLGWDFRYWKVTVDSDGVIYACCNGRISRINGQGRIMSSFSTWCDPSDHRYSNYNTPNVDDLRVTNGIIYATLKRNIIFTSRSVTDEIQAYTADGRCIARYFFAKTDFNTPSVLAVQPDGTFAVGQGYTDTSMAGYIVSADGKQFTDMKTGSNFTSIVAAPENSYYLVDGSFLSRMNSAGDIVERITCCCNNMLTSTWPVLENRHVWAICSYPAGKGLCVLSSGMGEDEGQPAHGGNWDVRVLDFSGRLQNTVHLNQSMYDSIAAGRDGSIYAMSSNYHGMIIKYDAQGRIVYTLNDRGWQIGQIDYPQGVLPDINGNLLVADTGNSRIQVFSPEGKPLGVWGKAGSGQGELAEPRSIAFGPGDTFWIADTDNDRIVIVPRQQFYKELKKVATPPSEPVMLSKKEPLPKPGNVTLKGIITADARDGSVYAQHATGCWGVKLELPKGLTVKRGSGYKIVGTLISAAGTNTVKVKSVSLIKSIKPCILSVANAVISRPLNSKSIPDGVMVATWGRVKSVDTTKHTFNIADGSIDGTGITVKCGKAIANAQPTKQGQYVAVTGISLKNTLQIREASDIKHLERSTPTKATVARL